MRQRIIEYFIKYECKEETIKELNNLFDCLEEREPKFNDFIEWLVREIEKPDTLLVPKGLYNLLWRNFEDSIIYYESKKKLEKYKNDME